MGRVFKQNRSNNGIRKKRIGYDQVEDYEHLYNFINLLKSTGIKTFIIHARKAMLGKFTPKQNLNIPPLKYEMVYKLKEDFKELDIVINGGITSVEQIKNHIKKVDGVMVGRSIYHSPYLLADIEKEISGTVLPKAILNNKKSSTGDSSSESCFANSFEECRACE